LDSYGGMANTTAIANVPLMDSTLDSTLATTSPAQTSTTGGFAEKGEAAFKSGDYAGASQQWRHAIVDNPQSPLLGLMLGQSLFAEGKYADAAGILQSSLMQIPKDKWGTVVANSRELYGNYMDYTTQLRSLETAAAAKPDDPGMRFLLGYHYAYLGYPKQAVDQLDKVIKQVPSDQVAQQLRSEMAAKLPKSDSTVNPAGPAVPPPPPNLQRFFSSPSLGGKPTGSQDSLRSPRTWYSRRSEQNVVYHNRNNQVQCWGAKSFADDLVTGRGVVLSRAATTLRSVETKPLFFLV
jgi:tetratricopeptide (TPR) repeat protein